MSASESLSVLLIVRDALERAPLTAALPASIKLTIVHAECEAALTAWRECRADLILLALGDPDSAVAFQRDLLARAGSDPSDLPWFVLLCLPRHAAAAHAICLAGQGLDYVIKRPTIQADQLELALRHAATRKAERWAFRSHRKRAARILAVDDNPVMRQLLTAILVRAGYEVQTAASGEDAINILDRERFGLVVLDVMMPGRDGYDVLRHIRQSDSMKFTPVIVVSAYADAAMMEAAHDAGANELLEKPVEKGKLIDRIAAHLH